MTLRPLLALAHIAVVRAESLIDNIKFKYITMCMFIYFPHPFRPALVAHPAPCTMGTGSFSGVKRPESGADPPPPLPSENRGH
jgi:hypothetical protein